MFLWEIAAHYLGFPWYQPTSLPPATKLGQGHIFRSVCQEFCPQGVVSAPLYAWMYSPRPEANTPWSKDRHPPPRADRPEANTPPPRHSASWAATSGRYASYWNAYIRIDDYAILSYALLWFLWTSLSVCVNDWHTFCSAPVPVMWGQFTQ